MSYYKEPWTLIDKGTKKKYFRLANFKGGTTVTNNSTYTPTEYEKQLQKAQANYADAVAPNALYLNDVARNLLQDSIGTVQVDYNTLNQNAQNQIANANGNLAGLAGLNAVAAANANDTLNHIAQQYGLAANNNYGRLQSIADMVKDATGTTDETLSSLQSGIVPTAYQSNMEKAIRTALNNTMGANLNSLAQRGVLNSSVTNRAMNDISANAADAVAQQYQQNINQSAGLAQQRLGNVQNLGNTQNTIYNQQYDQLTGALGNQANLAQQRYTNTLGANEANRGIYNDLVNNATAPITAAAVAQEAAQNPATNLWNASLGLNNSTTGALSSAAGKGTTTSTQTQSGGNGFLSGLLGAAGSLGSAAIIACFKKGTKILMYDGSEKNIEDVKVGDIVVSAENAPVKVTKKMKPVKNYHITITTDNGRSVTTTDTQPLMKADGEYIDVQNLTIGTALINVLEVAPLRVTNMEDGEFDFVYDIETDGDNSYIANGFIAKGGGLPYWEE